MSAEADSVVFENSVMDHSDPALFNERKINFITDSTSNGSGVFSSGQISFDLSTFSSQNWQSLNEAYIEFPVKLTAKLTRVATGTGAAGSICGAFTTVLKNGFHQWINSSQLIVNGQTIQSQQPFENVAAQYRILSGWSQDTLQKWGKTCNVVLDDCTADTQTTATSISAIGLNNAPYATVATSSRGFDAVNNQPVLANRGLAGRQQLLNADTAAATLANTILGSAGFINAGKSNVGRLTSINNVVNTDLYSQFIMATVRVKDLFDINEFPLVKNMKGYMYLTFNSAQTTVTGGADISLVASAPTTTLTGLTCPYNVITSSAALPTGGLITGENGGAAGESPIITITGTVDGSSTGAIAGSGPILTNARLLMPYYNANPRTDSALSKVQRFRTLEKITNPFGIAANGTANYTLTVGVPNPRKLILLPLLSNLGGGSDFTNPEMSCFDTTPATSSPFARISQLQITVANKPLFQYPLDYDSEVWFNEISQDGANGGKVDEMTSGLLTSALWENHRYYAIDLARRLESDDGMSRSVQVSCKNPSNFAMKVIAILFYEKHWEINTNTCMIQSV